MSMEIEAFIKFKCPECLRFQEVPFNPEDVHIEITTEPCPVHGQHEVLMLGMICPNCQSAIGIEVVSDDPNQDQEEELILP